MVPLVKKFSLITVTLFVAAVAVFTVLQFAQVSSARPLASGPSAPDSSHQPEAIDIPATGNWILVPNSLTSTMYMINTAGDVVQGPFLAGLLGTKGGGRFDVAVTPDAQTALISNFGDGRVFLVNVADPLHPSLITSVTLPFFAEDIAISPDGHYALVTDGGFSSVVAAIDILSPTQVITAQLGDAQVQAVEIAPDGTVIFADYWSQAVHSIQLSDLLGGITSTHTYTAPYPGIALTDTWGLPRPLNVGVAPDGQTVIACSGISETVDIFRIVAPGVLTSTGVITGLHGTDKVYTGSDPGVQSVAFNAAGTQAYAVVNGIRMRDITGTNSGDRLVVLNITGPGQVNLAAGGAVTLPHHTSNQLFGVDTLVVADSAAYVGYPSPSTSDQSASVAIVNLANYQVTTRLVYSLTDFIPAGVAALPVHLDLHLSVSNPTPHPGEEVVYTLVLSNAGPQVSEVSLLDSPDTELAGPVSLFPSSAGVVGNGRPVLVSHLTIPAWQQVVVSFPVTVGALPDGTSVVNTVFATSPQLSNSGRADRTFRVTWPKLYLPALLRP